MGSMNPLKNAILSYLKLHGQVKKRNLVSYLRNTGFKIGERRVRDTIVELQDDGFLITSSSAGYKLADKPEDYEKAIKYWRSYALKILGKIRKAKQNYQRLVKPQLF